MRSISKGQDRMEVRENETISDDCRIYRPVCLDSVLYFVVNLTINIRNSETFCHNFELSSRVPKELIDDAVKSGQLQFLDLEGRKFSITAIFDEITRAIEADSESLPLRVCIPSLGSPIWGDVTVQVILYISQEIIFTERTRAYCTSCILLSPLCVNTDMLVLL
jgi:elongator complex protein 4